jgi:hypothetical protein
MNIPESAPPVLPWRWFPLVQRPRPPAQPLASRVGELTEIAARLRYDGPVVQAAEICNKAALIASDCGLPDLARDLCWRQHETLRQAELPPQDAVELVLQPLLNLARQHIRDGHGHAACAMLETLYRAARERTDVIVDGHPVRMRTIVATPETHKAACMRLWTSLLADGTRALATAGRWQDAAARASFHRGIGARLLDGRQVRIIAFLHSGQPAEALRLTIGTVAAENWEKTVQHLLRIACLRSACRTDAMELPGMLTAILDQLESATPANAVFCVRAGIMARDLARGSVPAMFVGQLADIAANDARAAQDVLQHPALRDEVPAAAVERLRDLVTASGLGVGAIPESLHHELMRAVVRAEDSLYAPAAGDSP